MKLGNVTSSLLSSNSTGDLEWLSIDDGEGGEVEADLRVVACVLLEMALSFLGILTNLLVVTTIRHHEAMQNSSLHLLLTNLCFSNLLTSFLVKPISAIYSGYSLSVGTWRVSLVFCSVFTLIMCTTLCILPFTLVALSWLKLAPSLRATLLYPRQPGSLDRPVSTLGSYLAVPPSSCSSSPAPLPGVVSPVSCPHLHCHAPSPPPPLSPDSKRRLAELSHDLSLAQKISLASMWLLAACYGITACYPEKIFGQVAAVSRDAGDPERPVCSLRAGADTFLAVMGVAVTLVLPALLGPGLLLVLAPLLWACHRRPAPAPPRPRPGPASHAPSFAFILALAAVFLGTYSLNLVISELYVEDSFGFLVVKNTLGGLHLVLVPGLVLACHQDIRRGLGAVFGSSVLCRVASPASDTQHQDMISHAEDVEDNDEAGGGEAGPAPGPPQLGDC